MIRQKCATTSKAGSKLHNTPIFDELRRELPVNVTISSKVEDVTVVEIEVHVIRGDNYDEWFVLPSVPRVGDFFNTGSATDIAISTFKVAEVYWLPLGTDENTNSHVAIFLEEPKANGKKPHPWKNR